ncbi:hypothetical protein POTOM_005302 [Populus tomentosa]|uniref:Uncharacterized protein n=1 Tax=Populus tomentosa TaxID=118781 RepID=A0A8X8AM95_POPTO|nr:hypothetical protein POTOM_005302 [Populus tomentosa]
MGHFSAIFSCFVPSASSRVRDEAHNKAEIPKSKSKSSGAPIEDDCFVPSFPARVSSDNVSVPEVKAPKSEKSKGKSKSSGAPIVVSYFPVNSYPSRL